MSNANQQELLLERAYRHVRERPDAIYMTQPMGNGRVEEFSWARTFDEAKRVAAYLKSFDLPPNSQIAILSKNCAWFMITDLAIWMAGHVSVAIYPTLTAKEVRYILDHSESKVLFVGKLDDWDDIKDGVPDDLPCVAYPLSPPTDYKKWKDVIAQHEPIEGWPSRAADDTALIVYTSGSTGVPKGVVHAFEGISKATSAVAKVLSVTKDDRMLSYLPLAHVIERWVVECGSFSQGFHIFFAESQDTFVQDLQRARPTLFVSVPRLWLKFQLGVLKKMPPKKLDLYMKIPILSGIVKKKVLTGLGLDQVRFAGSGSAPIPADLISWYRRLGLELLEAYGMSENFAYSHVSMPGRSRVGYVGNPYPEVEQRLGEGGEIQVKSPANMTGYFKAPELTAEAFTEDGFLRTGDIGEIDDQGRLKITGRLKELFKSSKGKYVAPAPIENLLNADPHIELSCVSGEGFPQPHAVLQLAEDLLPELEKPGKREEVDAALQQLLKDVNADLPKHEQLAFLVVPQDRWSIGSGTLTATLKIRRGAIEKGYSDALESWYGARKPVVWA